jgi:hypothetical protein
MPEKRETKEFKELLDPPDPPEPKEQMVCFLEKSQFRTLAM